MKIQKGLNSRKNQKFQKSSLETKAKLGERKKKEPNKTPEKSGTFSSEKERSKGFESDRY